MAHDAQQQQPQQDSGNQPALGTLNLGPEHDPFKRQMVEQRLLGKNITFWCLNYIYTGKVSGVYADQIELSEPQVVYETGDFGDPKWKDAQPLPNTIFIMRRNIESWGVLK